MKPILKKKEKSVSKSEQMLAALQEQDLALADRYFEQALTTDSEEELLDWTKNKTDFTKYKNIQSHQKCY